MTMTMKHWFAPLPIALFLIAGCGTKEQGGDAKADVMRERIAGMEDSLFTKMNFDQRGAQGLFDVYKAYVAAFPTDSMAPEFLFRAASVAKVLYDANQSIVLYDRIIQDYSYWERLPDVYYMKAFTIDSDLGQKGEAKRAYQEVINLFPDHAFAADARVMLENLDYTDAELIERFKAMEAERAAEESAKR